MCFPTLKAATDYEISLASISGQLQSATFTLAIKTLEEDKEWKEKWYKWRSVYSWWKNNFIFLGSNKLFVLTSIWNQLTVQGVVTTPGWGVAITPSTQKSWLKPQEPQKVLGFITPYRWVSRVGPGFECSAHTFLLRFSILLKILRETERTENVVNSVQTSGVRFSTYFSRNMCHI